MKAKAKRERPRPVLQSFRLSRSEQRKLAALTKVMERTVAELLRELIREAYDRSVTERHICETADRCLP